MPLGNALQGLIALAAIVIAAFTVGRLFRRIRQPTVLGPIVVGIVVGTGVTACPDSVRSALVSDTTKHLLDDAGTAGLLLLMFAVGAELRSVQAPESVVGWRLLPCILFPIAVCAVVARPFAEHLDGPRGSACYGWLFVGIALGVTAVPVLVSIVQDLGIAALLEARVALRISIATDAFAWILVTALVVATSHITAVSVPALGVGAALTVIVTLVLPRVIGSIDAFSRSESRIVAMAVAALLGAAGTQVLGMHPAVGAIIAGFFFPAAAVGPLSQRTISAIVGVLLPAFFVSIAMSVPLQALRELISWDRVWCAVALAVAAVASKLSTGFLYGATVRWRWRRSARLGVLLNCRGVTEIAIASVGYQAGLIGPFAFALLCTLAIVTTAATAPLYTALARRDSADAASQPAERSDQFGGARPNVRSGEH